MQILLLDIFLLILLEYINSNPHAKSKRIEFQGEMKNPINYN